MKNRNERLSSAKMQKQNNYPFVQKESFESSPLNIPKMNKYKNLSLTINNNNKEKSNGFISPNAKSISTRFIRSLSNNNIYPSLTNKNIPNKSIKNLYSNINNSSKFSSF